MSETARWKFATCGILVLASIMACTPLPDGPIKAYDGPDRPAAEVSILQVSGCAAAIRVDGVNYNRNCNPLLILSDGDHLLEVEQQRAGRPKAKCTLNEVSLSWKRDFCESVDRYLGIIRLRLKAGHIYYVGICKWQQLWAEDLTENGSVIVGSKPELEPNACPDLRQDALSMGF